MLLVLLTRVIWPHWDFHYNDFANIYLPFLSDVSPSNVTFSSTAALDYYYSLSRNYTDAVFEQRMIMHNLGHRLDCFVKSCTV